MRSFAGQPRTTSSIFSRTGRPHPERGLLQGADGAADESFDPGFRTSERLSSSSGASDRKRQRYEGAVGFRFWASEDSSCCLFSSFLEALEAPKLFLLQSMPCSFLNSSPDSQQAHVEICSPQEEMSPLVGLHRSERRRRSRGSTRRRYGPPRFSRPRMSCLLGLVPDP